MLANPKRTKDEIVQWIRSYFESNGPGCDAVVGISGGKDSSVVAALCVEALGKERVVGVMMPNGEQPDLDDSKQLIEFLGIRYAYTDISKYERQRSDEDKPPSPYPYGDPLCYFSVVASRRTCC